jgi:hypothetical protein
MIVEWLRTPPANPGCYWGSDGFHVWPVFVRKDDDGDLMQFYPGDDEPHVMSETPWWSTTCVENPEVPR